MTQGTYQHDEEVDDLARVTFDIENERVSYVWRRSNDDNNLASQHEMTHDQTNDD